MPPLGHQFPPRRAIKKTINVERLLFYPRIVLFIRRIDRCTQPPRVTTRVYPRDLQPRDDQSIPRTEDDGGYQDQNVYNISYTYHTIT